MKNNKKKTMLAYFLGVIAALIWGGSMVVIKDITSEIHMIQLMATRLILALIVMSFFILLKIVKVRYNKKDIGVLLIIGIIQPCIYGSLEVSGVAMTTASEGSVFLALAPIVALIVAGVFLKQKVTLLQILCIILSFAGVIIMTLFGGNFKVGGNITGYFVLLAAVLVGAIYSGSVSKYSSKYSSFEITYVMTIVGSIVFNSLNFICGFGIETYTTIYGSMDYFIEVAYLGILSSFCGFVSFNYALANLPVHSASAIVLSGTTVTGVVLGILILGEAATFSTFLGTAFMIIGIIGVNYGKK